VLLPDSADATRAGVAHAVAEAPVRLAMLTALVCTVGAVAVRYAVLPRWTAARRADGGTADGGTSDGAAEGRVATFGLIAASVGGVAVVLRVFEQLGQLADPDDVRGAGALAGIAAAFPVGVLLATRWGRAAVVALAAFALAAAGCWRARRRAARAGRALGVPGTLGAGWRAAAAGALVLAVVPAWLGHGAADETSPWLSPLADALHVAAAGVWVGGLAVAGMLALPDADAPPRERPAGALLALVRAFSPVALGAGALLLASGVVSAWLRLRPALAPLAAGGDWAAALRATGVYGAVLAAKAVAAAGVAAFGAWNWRRGTPRLAAAGGRDDASAAAAMRASVAWELALAGVALAITAALVAMPPPSG